MNDDRSKSTSGWGSITVVMLPLVYVLSIGPVFALMRHYHVSGMSKFLLKFYAPVYWLHANTLLNEPLEDYGHLWGLLSEEDVTVDLELTGKSAQVSPLRFSRPLRHERLPDHTCLNSS